MSDQNPFFQFYYLTKTTHLLVIRWIHNAWTCWECERGNPLNIPRLCIHMTHTPTSSSKSSNFTEHNIYNESNAENLKGWIHQVKILNPSLSIVVVLQLINPDVQIITVENTPDDPRQRKPDITKAKSVLGWEPTIKLSDGIPLMEDDFRSRLGISRKKWAIIGFEWWTHLRGFLCFHSTQFFHSLILLHLQHDYCATYKCILMSILIYDYRIFFICVSFIIYVSNCGWNASTPVQTCIGQAPLHGRGKK